MPNTAYMRKIMLTLLLFLSSSGCTQKNTDESVKEQSWTGSSARHTAPNAAAPLLTPAEQQYKRELIQKYSGQIPDQWGERVAGVKRKMRTNAKVVALTFDACGGPGGSGYDAKLIDYLIKEQIPATLFINSRWIDANKDVFMSLARNPLFEIENHGHLHKPLSVNGKSAWGITGTRSIGEALDEVWINTKKIEALTGRRPVFFRSGTAYYDNVAARLVYELGLNPVGFDVLGDAGATFSAQQIKQAFQSAKPGSVVICHMNHPEKDTAEGVMLGVPELKKSGFTFVKLDTYPLE